VSRLDTRIAIGDGAAMLRRQVLTMLAYGASAMACSAPEQRGTRAPSPTRVPTTPATDFVVRTEYPPIAPFGDDVYLRRRARARELARAAKGDVMLVTSGSANFVYLVGGEVGRSERLIALMLPVDGEPMLLAPSFEVARVKQRARAVDVVGWEESDDPLTKIRDWLGVAGRRATILIEPHTEYAVAAALGRLVPDATLLDGSRAFEDLRAVKNDEEIARMRRAIAITEDAFAATFDRLAVGMLEKDVARIIREEHARRGADGYALVQFGASAALPHGGPTAAALTEGTGVLIDGGCSFQGWQSDITRTRWFGRGGPSDRFRAIYNLVHDAQTAAIQRVRPGVPAQEIDRAARAVIRQGGFGDRFTHRLGHGIGMEGHEAVYMVEGNTRPLEPGLVFSVEPGIYVPSDLGVRLEDQVACAATGADVLSRRAPRM
jgi:Xaa-Pro dipeptidase